MPTIVPESWPVPNNPDTRARVFRVEIERPESGAPQLTGHMQEAFEVGTTPFRNYRPDLAVTGDLVTLMGDEDTELAEAAKRCAADLNLIIWKLYERKLEA